MNDNWNHSIEFKKVGLITPTLELLPYSNY